MPVRRLLVLLATLALLLAPAGARADDAAAVYDPATVTVVDLSMDAAALAQLRAVPKEYVDAGATFTLPDGRTLGPFAIGVRTKGTSTLLPIDDKASLKLKFAFSVKKQKVLGLKGMTLNNMVQDATYVRETLAYAAMRAGGVPAARTGYAYVRLNGVGKGLYLNLEPYDSVFLDAAFPSTDHLFEGESSADFATDARGRFEVDEGDEAAQGDLDAAIGAAAGWPANASPSFDRAELLRLFAGESFVGHWDSYSNMPAPATPGGPGFWRTNNFYAHSDATGRFSLLPSGMDQTLASTWPGLARGQGILSNRCWGDAGCLADFKVALRAFSSATAVAVPGVATQAAATVARWRTCSAQRLPSTSSWRGVTTDTFNFLRGRPARVAAYTGGPALPAVPTPPVPQASTAPCPLPGGDPGPGPDPDPSPTTVPTTTPTATPTSVGSAGTPGPAPAPAPGTASAGTPAPATEPSPAPAGAVAGAVRSRACVVPHLRGRTVKGARRLLRAHGCRPGTVTRSAHARRVPRGAWRIRRSQPGAGTRHPANTRVTLVAVPRKPARAPVG